MKIQIDEYALDISRNRFEAAKYLLSTMSSDSEYLSVIIGDIDNAKAAIIEGAVDLDIINGQRMSNALCQLDSLSRIADVLRIVASTGLFKKGD